VNEHPRLRCAVLVDRDWLPEWQRAVVQALLDGDDVELVARLRADDPRVAHDGRRTPRGGSLWRAYNNGVVARRSLAVARAGGWGDVLPSVPVISIGVEERGKFSQYVLDADVAVIRDLGLDVIIRFGLGIIRGGILGAARHGVWSYHHDDERVIRGGPPSFWEIFDGLPTSGVVLQRLTERLDGGVPLARATFRTVSHSYPRNRDRTLLGAAGMPAQVARAVRFGLVDPDALPVSTSDAPVRRNPSNREMLRFLAGQARRAVTVRARGVLAADVWAVGVAAEPETASGDVVFPHVEWVPELAANGYLADPFPAARDGRTALLVEEFDEAAARGVISALERTDRGWRLHSAVLDPGAHASYPFLVVDGGELYCIPETWEARRVERWRCVEFPWRWERAGILVDGAAVVDPTVVHHSGRWWLLGTLRDDDPDTKLHAWSAPAFAGPYTPHPLNPVKIDVTGSRPAGTPFVVDGVLHRPAQDCSTSYGSGVVVQRVESLGPAGLVEAPVGRVVLPHGRYRAGTHTLASGAGLWAVDGRRYGANRHRFAREVRGRIRRLRARRR
jgi:hypothetical protein